MTTRKYLFNTLADFYAAVLAVDQTNSDKWYGATVPETMARRFNWPEGVSKLETLPGINPVPSGNLVRVWSDYDGDDMDVERFRDGFPFMSRRIRETGRRSRHIANVFVHVGEHGAVSAADMLWKAYAAARLVDELESGGTRCCVWAVCFSKEAFLKSPKDYALQIKLKGEDEPLNSGALVSAFSPWLLRRWVIAHIYEHSDFSMGAGYPREWNTENLPEHSFLINRGQCLSESAAREYLQTVNENQAAQAVA